MKILLPFRLKNISQPIVSSAFAKFKNNPTVNVEFEIFNLDNRNIAKYLRKKREAEFSGVQNSLPTVIYVLDEEKELIEFLISKYPNIHIELYTKQFAYKPERVPGNELPTIAYFLYDKIMYDIYSCYKRFNMYYINKYELTIKENEIDEFEFKHPYSNVIFNNVDYYSTREEAIRVLKEEINKKKLSKLKIIKNKQDEIQKLNNQIIKLHSEIAELTEFEMRCQ